MQIKRSIMDLEIQTINDGTFRVVGNSVKLFNNELNTMGGKYDEGYYIFDNASRDRVSRFIDGIQTYVSPSNYSLNKGNDRYQTVVYTVQKPNNDMKIKLKYGDFKFDYNIVRIKENQGIVDEVYIKSTQEDGDGSVSKLVICNGKWQVLGFTELHEIEFVTE